MEMRIVKFGEGVLKERSKEVESFDESLKKLSSDMLDSMYAANGLGLAGPQVGVLKRIFVIDMRRRSDDSVPCVFSLDGKSIPLDLAMPLVAVNPKIELLGDYVEITEEGCLSFPGIYAEVERAEKVRLNYFDTDGVPHELVCEGLFARCVQHENDHLDGISFVDRLSSAQLFKIAPKLKRLKCQTRDFLKSQKH